MTDFISQSEYPEDRAEIYGEHSDEEAHFYFVLNDFERLLIAYGAHFIMTRMRNEAFDKLNVWFSETTDPGTRKERCFLTSTRKPLSGSVPPT